MAFTDPMQAILDELDEDLAQDDLADFAPMPTPASANAASAALRRVEASAAAAAEKRSEADRKRDERAARREARLPDTRAVDVALGQALAEILRGADAAALIAKSGTVREMKVAVEPILAFALQTLVDKGTPKRDAARVLQKRLFPSRTA